MLKSQFTLPILVFFKQKKAKKESEPRERHQSIATSYTTTRNENTEVRLEHVPTSTRVLRLVYNRTDRQSKIYKQTKENDLNERSAKRLINIQEHSMHLNVNNLPCVPHDSRLINTDGRFAEPWSRRKMSKRKRLSQTQSGSSFGDKTRLQRINI